jgi:hypothetical protein
MDLINQLKNRLHQQKNIVIYKKTINNNNLDFYINIINNLNNTIENYKKENERLNNELKKLYVSNIIYQELT